MHSRLRGLLVLLALLALSATSAAGGRLEGHTAPINATFVTISAESALTAERTLAARDYLDLTDGGAGAAVSLDVNPNDPTALVIWDEFGFGGSSTGLAGMLGWAPGSVGAAPTISKVASTWPELGVHRITTTSTSGQGGTFTLGGNTFQALGELGSNASWEMTWRFKLTSAANVRLRVGFGGTANVVEPTDGCWVRFDTNVAYADTNFMLVCRAASVNSTAVNTNVAGDTAWHKVRLRSSVAGTVIFNFDGGADQTISAQVPTTAQDALAVVVTDTTAAKDLDLGFFAFKARGLSR
jgi:hypothetical protein